MRLSSRKIRSDLAETFKITSDMCGISRFFWVWRWWQERPF